MQNNKTIESYVEEIEKNCPGNKYSTYKYNNYYYQRLQYKHLPNYKDPK